MKAIVIAVCLSCLSLIFVACSTQPLPPQIVKVKQKSAIPITPYPDVINAKDWCKPHESECIIGIATYNFVVVAEAFAIQNENEKAYR